MAERKGGRKRVIVRTLVEIILPALVFFLGVGFATQDYPASLVTGLAISASIYVLYRLDRAFLHPRLEKLSRDWLQVGLEMTLSLLEHVLGALSALLVCSRVLGFQVVGSAAWAAVGGMVIVFPIVHGTETALRFYRRLKEKERLEERLRALATQAELKALKAQINPHFLFNVLNTIAALIHTDPVQAEATVERLAQMLRHVLVASEQGLVPLEEELAFVDSYLKIEEARFGKRLRVSREIASEALDVAVPSLILQPLVENAIQYGWGSDGSVDLTIHAQPQSDEVVVSIVDHGPGISPDHRAGKGPGHGLRNVDERLRKTYGETYGLEIGANEPQGTIVTIRIPAVGET
jgi:signal transduction histidine kinase